MHHIIYKTEHPNGKFYVGRHSTNNLEDNYMGSGRWVRSLRDKTVLKKTILEFAETLEELRELEEKYINMFISEENCMNFNNNSCGFATGELNPNASEERKKILSEKIKGPKNPMYGKPRTEQAKAKLRESNTGEGNPMYGRQHTEEAKAKMSKKKIGQTHSEETRQKFRDNHKNGLYSHLDYGLARRGKPLSDELKAKISASHKKIPKQKCEHCGIEAKPNAIARWHNSNCKTLRALKN